MNLSMSQQQACTSRRRLSRGFTLIELVVTVAIIGLIATLALPLSEMTVRRTKEQALRRALFEIRDAIDAYKLAADEGRIARKADEPGFPATLDVLVEGVVDLRDPRSRRIYFLRQIPRDPFYPDPSVSALSTWGIRSYGSPPEDPRPGQPVFDVHSLAQGTGSNGLPYRQW